MLREKKCKIKAVLLKKIWTIVLTVIILQEKEILVYNIVTASTFNDKIQYPILIINNLKLIYLLNLDTFFLNHMKVLLLMNV